MLQCRKATFAQAITTQIMNELRISKSQKAKLNVTTNYKVVDDELFRAAAMEKNGESRK